MNRCTISLSIVLALSIGPTKMHAQETANNALAKLVTDSAAWQHVLAHVVGALSAQLVAGATDTAAQPWRLRLPPDDPQRQLLQAQLRTVLRAREPVPSDTVVRLLEFGPLLISNDTARVDVSFEETRKCPSTGRTTGFGWSTTVLVPRVPRFRFWGTAFSRATTHGDRMTC
jgi:hypothetical protein